MADGQAADLSHSVNAWLLLILAVVAILALNAGDVPAAEDGRDLTISGTIRLDDSLVAGLEAGDRLIIKIYHPGAEAEHDPKYAIKDDFDLPLDFRMTPPIDMNGRARWPDYVVEAFTDKDADILSVVEGELFASTGNALALGTRDVVLDLKPR